MSVRRARDRAGLVGRIVAILLAAIAFEFAASAFLYSRADNARVHEDDAHRVAEHLALAHQLLASRPPAERPALAERLSTNALVVRWEAQPSPRPPVAPDLDAMRAQIVGFEPALADDDLRLYLQSPGRNGMVRGSLSLQDGSLLSFSTPETPVSVTLAVGRIALALIPAVALVLIAGLLVRNTLRPLSRLSAAAEVVGGGGQQEVAPAGRGEVRRVIHAFNAMQKRIHQLIADRTQALAAVGHDLRTPIARLQLRTEEVAEPDLRAALQADAAEMEQMLASLLRYFGGEDPEPPARCDIAVLAQTVADECADSGEDVTYEGPDHLDLVARPGAIKRALGNLVENALHYGGAARITLARSDGKIEIAVHDEGPGIPPDRLSDVFQPFVRLDPARSRNTNGLGLGIPIAARVAEEGGGALTLANREKGGLTATLTLPLT